MIQFRDYQLKAIDALWAYFTTHVGNPLVLMPTGTGKSLVNAGFIQRMFQAYPGSRVASVTHVEKLISQNSSKLLELWPTAPVGVYSASLDRREIAPITFAGIQSVVNIAAEFGYVDILIIDEAHLVSPNDETRYQKFIAELKKINPKLKVIGLTATGWRLGLGNLVGGGIFTDVAVDMTTLEYWIWFVDQGYLSPLSAKGTKLQLDVSGVKLQGGEYVLSQLQGAVDKEEVTRAAVLETLEWAQDRQCWLVFGTGVEHCEHIAELLNEYGIDAVAIHSKTKNPQGKLQDFELGKYRAVVSMNKLTTGIDIAHIDLIVVLRNTQSSSLWVQMLGRGTRPVYGDVLDMAYDSSSQAWRLAAIAAGPKPKGCLVLDFAGNTERLGPVNNPAMPFPKGKKRKFAAPCPVKKCSVCSEYVPAMVRQCPSCGSKFLIAIKLSGEASTLEVMTRKPVPDPIVEIIDIERVTYRPHQRRNSDKPPSLRVSYYAKGLLRKFEQYVCFEHSGTARRRAEDWWLERVPPQGQGYMPIPGTVEEACKQVEWLLIPKRMRVWVNTTHPEILSYEYE